MENQTKENPNIEIAIQASQKFEFYVIALVFTILGLSIQTSTVIGGWQCLFEILSWITLLTSGFAGLSRLEWAPIAYTHAGWLQKEQDVLNMLNKGLRGRVVLDPSGQQWSQERISEEKSKQEEHISKRKAEKEKVEKRLEWKYTTHKWCFVAGILCLVISRAILSLSKFFV